MIDQNGNRYRADADDDETIIQTETAGPLRTVVRVHAWHKDKQGRRFCRAILRLHYYAGLDQVRILHSFVMDADPEKMKIRGVGLRLVPSAPIRKVLLAGEQNENQVIEADADVTLLQDRDDHFVVTGSERREGRRSGTWLCAIGERNATGVFVRNGWEEFPKALKWDGDQIDVQIWPNSKQLMQEVTPLPSFETPYRSMFKTVISSQNSDPCGRYDLYVKKRPRPHW